MTESSLATSQRSTQSRPATGLAVWVGFALALGLLGTAVVVGLRSRTPEPQTVSEVVRSIRETVLAGHHSPNEPRAGLIGPWFVAAESFDAAASTFRHFRIDTDTLKASAASARLSIDVESNSFTFHLSDVRMISLPADPDPEVVGEILTLDAYDLGPIPLRTGVVKDSASTRRMPAVQPTGPAPVSEPQRRASVFDDLP